MDVQLWQGYLANLLDIANVTVINGNICDPNAKTSLPNFTTGFQGLNAIWYHSQTDTMQNNRLCDACTCIHLLHL